MTNQRSQKLFASQFDVSSPAAVERFRALSASYAAKATVSKEAAEIALKRMGILNAKGNLAKHYSIK